MIYCAGRLMRKLKSYFIKAIDHTFYGFTAVITHVGCCENTRKLVNHSPPACNLQAFLVFSQHPTWVITPVIPKNVWTIA